jgi:hypothetical protein
MNEKLKASSSLTPVPSDGFDGILTNRRGTYISWTEARGWEDGNGQELPSPLLVVAWDEGLRRWDGNRATLITDKPLPDPETLNEQIPPAEWGRDFNGNPDPPWKHVVIVLLVNPKTGALYKFISPTYGAKQAYNALEECILMTRALRGFRVLPLIHPTKAPMKTRYGLKQRPHFEIIDYFAPGDGNQVPAPTPPPQLTGPTAAQAPAAPVPPEPAQPSTSSPRSHVNPKPTISLGDRSTLAAMQPVKPITTEELLNDSLDDLPWDA